jgi:hypothetical protein
LSEESDSDEEQSDGSIGFPDEIDESDEEEYDELEDEDDNESIIPSCIRNKAMVVLTLHRAAVSH